MRAPSSGSLQSRIEQHVAQIDDEIGDEHGGRHDEQLALDHRIVAGEDGLVERYCRGPDS